MLYLVATPIGNLGDITYRAIEILKASHYILCEDTRHSAQLLKHYEVQTPLHSFHKFNEASKEDSIIADLLSGASLSLISDAGTPGISDPGSRLVKRCISENIAVIPIPGPCAAIAAISCSGLNTELFQFLGFLPRKSSELLRTLQEVLSYPGTTICYESPLRLLDVLRKIHATAPKRALAVGRELTKKFEEFRRGVPSQLIEYFSNHIPKGEIVLLIDGKDKTASSPQTNLTPEEHVRFLQDTNHLPYQDAVKLAAKQRGIPKRILYMDLNRMQEWGGQ